MGRRLRPTDWPVTPWSTANLGIGSARVERVYAGEGRGAVVLPSRAEQIYEAVYDRLNLMPAGWLGSEIDIWMMLGWVRHQRWVELRNQEGIGVHHSVTRWAILPIDYAAVDLSPGAKGGEAPQLVGVSGGHVALVEIAAHTPDNS